MKKLLLKKEIFCSYFWILTKLAQKTFEKKIMYFKKNLIGFIFHTILYKIR